MRVLELYCHVDDFCQSFLPQWQRQHLATGKRRQRQGHLYVSELMTILIHFHQAHDRDFKAYYLADVAVVLRSEFPSLVSYQRCVELIPSPLGPRCASVQTCFGDCTGVSFSDSTALAVCHNRRISQHKVFAGSARRGKTSMGWCYGFKVQSVVNDRGELWSWQLTPGNTDDRKPVPKRAQQLFGKLLADKGYRSQPLRQQRWDDLGLQLITARTRTMPNKLLRWADKLLLRKRAIGDSIFDQLKNSSHIEPTRHRSPNTFLVNFLAGMIA